MGSPTRTRAAFEAVDLPIELGYKEGSRQGLRPDAARPDAENSKNGASAGTDNNANAV